MSKHIHDQADVVPVERWVNRCCHGIPGKGRCDLPHQHFGRHRIYGEITAQEEFFVGAHDAKGWVLTKRPSVKQPCSACGNS